MYTGHVFLKQTGAPLVGVKVSDGRNIALTDENGAFSLPGWERMHVINVGILTKSHDDWHCFAEGEAQTYDFYVTPADECADAHSFFHISDTEIDEKPALTNGLILSANLLQSIPRPFLYTPATSAAK